MLMMSENGHLKILFWCGAARARARERTNDSKSQPLFLCYVFVVFFLVKKHTHLFFLLMTPLQITANDHDIIIIIVFLLPQHHACHGINIIIVFHRDMPWHEDRAEGGGGGEGSYYGNGQLKEGRKGNNASTQLTIFLFYFWGLRHRFFLRMFQFGAPVMTPLEKKKVFLVLKNGNPPKNRWLSMIF